MSDEYSTPILMTSTWSFPPPAIQPGHNAGYVLLRDAKVPGPDQPDMTIYRTYAFALEALEEAKKRRAEGGYTYDLYISTIVIVKVEENK